MAGRLASALVVIGGLTQAGPAAAAIYDLSILATSRYPVTVTGSFTGTADAAGVIGLADLTDLSLTYTGVGTATLSYADLLSAGTRTFSYDVTNDELSLSFVGMTSGALLDPGCGGNPCAVGGSFFSRGDTFYLGASITSVSVTPRSVPMPEPPGLALPGTGILGLMFWRRSPDAA